MSKQMKQERSLFLIDLNQLITAAVFFHWCKLCFFAIVLLMRSRIFLQPNSKKRLPPYFPSDRSKTFFHSPRFSESRYFLIHVALSDLLKVYSFRYCSKIVQPSLKVRGQIQSAVTFGL